MQGTCPCPCTPMVWRKPTAADMGSKSSLLCLQCYLPCLIYRLDLEYLMNVRTPRKLRTGGRGGHDTVRVPAAACGAAGVHGQQLPRGPLPGAVVAAVSGALQAVRTGSCHCSSEFA